MSNVIPIVSYALGTVMLFGAAVYAVKNYQITRGISRYWLVYAIAMIIGGLVASIFFIQFAYGVNPLLNDVRTALSAMLAIMLVLVAVEMFTTDIAKILE